MRHFMHIKNDFTPRILFSLVFVLSFFGMSLANGGKWFFDGKISQIKNVSNQIEFHQMLEEEGDRFEEVEGNSIALRANGQACWLKLQVDFLEEEKSYFLMLNYFYLGKTELFYPDKEGKYHTIHIDFEEPMMNRLVQFHFHVFPLKCERKDLPIYLKVYPVSHIQFQPILFDEVGWQHEISITSIYRAILFTILGISMVFCLSWYIYGKNPVFLFYSLQVLSMLILGFSNTGILATVLSSISNVTPNVGVFGVMLSSFSFVLLFRSFFQNKANKRRFALLFVIPALLVVLGFLKFANLVSPVFAGNILFLLYLINLLAILVVGFSVIKFVSKEAWFLLLAYALVLVTITQLTLQRLGILPLGNQAVLFLIALFLENVLLMLGTIRLSISHHKNLLEKQHSLKLENQRYKNMRPLLSEASIRELLLEEKSNPMNWEEFNLRFKESHPVFSELLFAQHPHLTADEVRLCYLIFLNLKGKEIAQLLYIQPSSVDQRKYRLKLSLELEKSRKLGDYLHSLGEEK
ncbi:MAG: 7TM-DISM domain-containing protein [Crocinitomicaceae bacterium]